MFEPKLISPLLDGFLIGEPISDHHGIRCCPAMNSETNEKYIVKIISLPPSRSQLDAMMLTGALKDEEDAKIYYTERAKDWVDEIESLQQLSRQEGFISCDGFQVVPSEDGIGFEIYILTPYKRTLARQLNKKPFTQLDALNLGLDICSALAACRRNGYLFTNLKPSNIFVTANGEFKIGDLGFLKLNTLHYAAIEEHCLSSYTAPEITDAFSSVNETLDIYSLGMVLYSIYNDGVLPEDRTNPLPSPRYADEEMAQIILKACDPNPENRWTDPAQMGQMLVNYMQKNGAFDTPIVPPAPIPEPEIEVPEVAEEAFAEPENDQPDDEAVVAAVNEVPEIQENEELVTAEESDEAHSSEDVLEEMPVVMEVTPEIAEPAEEAEFSEQNAISDEETETAEQNEISNEDVVCEESAVTAAASSISADVVESSDCEQQLMEILENHDAFSDEVAQIKAAAAYLEIDNVQDISEDISYDDVSEEVGQILSQADVLAAMDVPEPVVAPEAAQIEVPQPEDEPADLESMDSDTETDTTEDELIMNSMNNESGEKAVRRPHWVRNSILIALSLLLIAGGFLFFKFYVLETVDQLELTGNNDCLIVHVDTQADETLLSVTCEDKYGSTITAPVHEGVAEFTGLRPELTYTVRVNISGLHILSGEKSDTYTTPDETALLNCNVITGNEIGTVVLNFAFDGPVCDNWTLNYATDGYEEQSLSFSGTSLTITDLLPDKLYTGVLEPEENLFITKPIEVSFSATELIQANDLKITSCSNGKLTVEWTAPETVHVENWTVRCYSGTDGATYDQTYTTSTTSYEFRDLNSADSFTVEVTAVGQTIVQKASIGENSVTVTNLTIDEYNNGTAILSWDCEAVPENGWIVSYTVDNASSVITTAVNDTTATIYGMIPNAEYSFTVQSADSVHTFCDSVVCKTADTEDFSIVINNKTFTTKNIDYFLFRQPSFENWGRFDITDSHFTNTFTLDDEAGFVVYLNKKYEYSEAEFYATIVIRNDKGEIVSLISHAGTWNSVWKKDNYYVFTLPTMPDEGGFYTATVYLNGQFAYEHPFTIQEP